MDSTRIEGPPGEQRDGEGMEIERRDYGQNFNNGRSAAIPQYGFHFNDEQHPARTHYGQTPQKHQLDHTRVTTVSAQPVQGETGPQQSPSKPVTQQQPRANSTTSTIMLDLPVEISEEELESDPGFCNQCLQATCTCCNCIGNACNSLMCIWNIISCFDEDNDNDDDDDNDEEDNGNDDDDD